MEQVSCLAPQNVFLAIEINQAFCLAFMWTSEVQSCKRISFNVKSADADA